MSKTRLLISLITTAIVFVSAADYYSLPFVSKGDLEDQFSVSRVAKDIQVISEEPHSIEHPKAREKVRGYLAKRLQDMDVTSIYYSYDSVLSRFKTPIDISDLYARIEPLNGESSSYILLVAHMDSRFRTKVLDREVYSKGAADDGYGLGVILESVRLAMIYRESWKQGVKILFTDSEESDLEGMKYALSENPEIFEKVGLVINVEARGVKGPAILFETSRGNEDIIKLYKSAKCPVSYSLTSAVYNFLPNSTDYSLLKDSFPGMNFSVIGNLSYYHTDLDNYENISLSSIQHYGEQITPIISRYLTDSTYSDSKSLVSDSKSIFFTLPLFGLIAFSSPGFLTFNLFTLLLFAGLIWFLIRRNQIAIKGVVKNIAVISFYSLASSIAGLCVALLCASFTGQKYSLVSLPNVKYEWLIITVLIIILSFAYLFSYMRGIRKLHYSPLESIVGNTAVQIIFSIALYVYLGENFFVLIPAFLAIIASWAGLFTKSGIACLIAHSLVLLLLLPFYYILVVTLTIGSLPVIMLLSTLLISLVIPLSDCYIRKLF